MSDDKKLVKVTITMPKDKHRKLKAIAALRDQGLSSYVMACVESVTFDDKTISKSDDLQYLEEVEALAKV
jgi:hypothetical protein